MKITILANKDIASNVALNILLPKFKNHDVTIFLSSSVGKIDDLNSGLNELNFFEQSFFNDLLFPLLPSSPTNKKPQLLSFDGLGKSISNPIIELNFINNEEEFQLFSDSEPDIVISIRYGVILKAKVIGISKYGVINLHSGLLPDYKGVMATFRAMLNGDHTVGTTLHYISDSSVDTGSIIGKTSIPVDKSKSYMQHVLELYSAGCDLIVSAIYKIEKDGFAESFKQEGDGNYYSFPSIVEIEDFRAKGFKMVDYQDIIELSRKYMAI